MTDLEKIRRFDFLRCEQKISTPILMDINMQSVTPIIMPAVAARLSGIGEFMETTPGTESPKAPDVDVACTARRILVLSVGGGIFVTLDSGLPYLLVWTDGDRTDVVKT